MIELRELVLACGICAGLIAVAVVKARQAWARRKVELSFNHSTFSTNRQRLLRAHVSQRVFDEVVLQADALYRLSDEHFITVERWTGPFRPATRRARSVGIPASGRHNGAREVGSDHG